MALCEKCISNIESCPQGQAEQIQICANCSMNDVSDYVNSKITPTIEWTEENKKHLLDLLNHEFLFLKNGEPIRRINMRDELKERVLNVDTVKEMFDLWYEVTFLRFLLTDIVNKNEELAKKLNEEVIEDCRRKAQVFLKDKFKIDLEYKNPENRED